MAVVIDGDAHAQLDSIFVAGGKIERLNFRTDGSGQILNDLFGLTMLGGKRFDLLR